MANPSNKTKLRTVCEIGFSPNHVKTAFFTFHGVSATMYVSSNVLQRELLKGCCHIVPTVSISLIGYFSNLVIGPFVE